jgi:hypothetical protein
LSLPLVFNGAAIQPAGNWRPDMVATAGLVVEKPLQ